MNIEEKSKAKNYHVRFISVRTFEKKRYSRTLEKIVNNMLNNHLEQ